MGKIAFVFSGQGDQFPGMGKDLYDKYPLAKSVYRLCDEIRPGTSSQCFEGTEEELKETQNTQPCLFAMELAAARILMEKGIIPDAAAGFSLGEVTAATVCGVFDNAAGFRLVCKRGLLMQREAGRFDTFMAAVVKLTEEQVQQICSRYPDIYPVNYNCPGQITVSGLSSGKEEFCADVKKAGGRAIPLKVTGAFHSPFMKDAAKAFALELKAANIHTEALAPAATFSDDPLKHTDGPAKFSTDPSIVSGDPPMFSADPPKAKLMNRKITLYSDKTGEPYGTDIIDLLSSQISSSVQWEKIIRNMISDDIKTFIEIGPGKTLSNMIRKIDPTVKAITVTEFLKEAEQCSMEKQQS